MEEELKISEEYKKWFNRGYHLRSTMPKVFKDMSIPSGEPKEITEAFEAGRKQFEKDFGYEKPREEFRNKIKDQFKNNDKEHGRGR
tara:strand:+ start:658 stop:915 length:258 start_codon:yes stop_codon:yes gene_type:complete